MKDYPKVQSRKKSTGRRQCLRRSGKAPEYIRLNTNPAPAGDSAVSTSQEAPKYVYYQKVDSSQLPSTNRSAMVVVSATHSLMGG